MPNLQVAHTCRRQDVIKIMHSDRRSLERLRNDNGWGLAGRGQCDRRTKDDAACRLLAELEPEFWPPKSTL